jgi:hypothetical protein
MGNRVLLSYGERQVMLFHLHQLSILAKKKGGNLERHYNALRSNKHDADFPSKSEICKLKLKELKSKVVAQEQLMAKPRLFYNSATISSFKVSNLSYKMQISQ